MKRIKLYSDSVTVRFDKTNLLNYMNKRISKQQAMAEIAKHNHAEVIDEEYFDYLVRVTGHDPFRYSHGFYE